MSNFVVSARKYRPVRFAEVVGQEHVSQTLKNALQNNHLAHAFLFCGPRGVGKTTCARILAKVLNCQNHTADFEPCNECPSCQAFSENASFNITELDAASNNSVEHIRALIEQVRFQPQQGKYKVFIIDEVHMLSQQAFNAFLKTLEEPPPYAIFILATTEKHKIIPTILSRCQIFDFRRIRIPDTVAHLEQICAQEGIEADKDALHIIAQKADGALRDALSIFDRIVSFSGKKVSYQDVITNLNVLDYDYYFQIVDAFLLEDVSKVLLIFDDILCKGFDEELFVNGLAEHLRNLLVCKDPQTLPLLESGENLRERYQRQAQISPAALLLTAMNLANDCDINYKMARNKRLHVEMSLIKMTHIQRAFRLSEATLIAAGNGAAAEKKTPDGNVDKVEEEVVDNVPVTEPVATDEKPVNEAVSTAIAENGNTKPSPAASPEPQKTATSGKHKLSAINLADLVAEAREDVVKEPEKLAELTEEALLEAWNRYIEELDTINTKTALKNTNISLDGHTILARAGSKFSESALREETRLMDFLRQTLKRNDLALVIELDENRKAPAPRKRAKPLTPKEKFILMREANPQINDLRKRLDLWPDED